MIKNFNCVTQEAGEVDACYESILPANAAFQAVHNKQISTSDRTQLPSLPDPNRGQASLTKPPSRSQLKREQKQRHKPRRYQPIVIVETETEVLVIDAEVLLAMLLVGGARK